MTTALAIKREISLPINKKAIDAVAMFIINRALGKVAFYSPTNMSNLTEEISEFFDIDPSVAEEIQDILYHDLPAEMKAVLMSVEWRGEILYQNPNYPEWAI